MSKFAVWVDQHGREWNFGRIETGDLFKIKRRLGVDLLGRGLVPHDVGKVIDSAGIILSDQMELNGVTLEDMADCISKDISGLYDALSEGLLSFFSAHQPKKYLAILVGIANEARAEESKKMPGKQSTPTQESAA